MKITEQRLDTLLKVKVHQQKKVQQELAKLLGEKEIEEKNFAELKVLKEGATGDFASNLKLRATEIQSSKAYIDNLTDKLTTQVNKLDQIQTAEEGKRGELLEKEKSKKQIEILSEKREAELIKERIRKDQRLMDILANRIRWSV